VKVLFIGGTGVISEACTQLAAGKGMELYLYNRGATRAALPEGVRVIRGDIRDVQGALRSLGELEFDVVVDWIAYERAHVENDIRIFSGRTTQYVFISSASVYQTPPAHYVVTESTPLSNPYWEYSRKKIECEMRLMDAWREDGFPAVVVRPSSTYGYRKLPGLICCGGWTLVNRLRQGKEIIVHGDGTSLWTFTHHRDFAEGFVGLLGEMRAVGHAFHITSDEVLTWNQICRTIAGAAGADAKIVHVPTDFIHGIYPDAAAGFMGERSHSTVYDNSKIRTFVPGYRASIPLREGVRETVEWFDRTPEAQVVDEASERMLEDIIRTYRRAFSA